MPPTFLTCPLPPLHVFFNIACPINVISPSYYLHFENRLHHCVLHGEMNKTRPHLHIFWRYFALLPTYVITSSLSHSNLCVYWFPVATTYAHRNFCFVSIYVYECMIDFVVVTNILYVYNRFYFICVQLVYKLMCMTTYVCDILCLWQFMRITYSIFVTTYVYNKLLFCGKFVSRTTYKHIFVKTFILYVCQLIFCICDNSYV